MKKVLLLASCILLLAVAAYAADDTVATTTSFTIQSIFSIEFFSDTSVRYSDGQITFPAIDPANGETMVMTTLNVPADGKSDVGVVCRTNINQDWALKVRLDESDPELENTNVAIYKPGTVYDRNTGTPYSTGGGDVWSIMSATDDTIYGGSGGLQNTAPEGMLATFSYSILPTGAAAPAGQGAIGYGNVLPQGTYGFDVVYTLTTTL